MPEPKKIEPSDQALIDEWLSRNTPTKLPDGVSLDLRVKDTNAKPRKPGGLTRKERERRALEKRCAEIESGN